MGYNVAMSKAAFVIGLALLALAGLFVVAQPRTVNLKGSESGAEAGGSAVIRPTDPVPANLPTYQTTYNPAPEIRIDPCPSGQVLRTTGDTHGCYSAITPDPSIGPVMHCAQGYVLVIVPPSTVPSCAKIVG